MTDVPASPSSGDPYDLLPYEDYCFRETHPDQLAAVAWMRGVEPPPVESARVLEIGCASGANLLPMAAGLPKARFVGLDRSGVQISTGQQRIADLGLDNVRLLQADLADAALLEHPELAGPFDYIIAHGLWSWMPEPARAGLLRLVGATLAPSGVAYVSAEMLPGARFRQMTRDLLHFHDDPRQAPAWRVDQATTILRSIQGACPENSLHGLLFDAELERAEKYGSSFIFHDRLSQHYAPVLLEDFVRQAGRHDLQFLGDAHPSHMLVGPLPSDLAQVLDREQAPLSLRLQYVDFVLRRVFRRILLTPAGPQLRWPPAVDRLDGLHVRGKVTVKEVTGDNVTGVERGCFEAIDGAWPASIPVAELIADIEHEERVRELVLQAWMGDAVQLRLRPARIATALPRCPRAPRASRKQAAEDAEMVVNAAHGLVQVEALHRVLLRAMDGRRDRSALLEEVVQAAAGDELDVRRNDDPVEDPELLRTLLDEPVTEALDELLLWGLVLEPQDAAPVAAGGPR